MIHVRQICKEDLGKISWKQRFSSLNQDVRVEAIVLYIAYDSLFIFFFSNLSSIAFVICFHRIIQELIRTLCLVVVQRILYCYSQRNHRNDDSSRNPLCEICAGDRYSNALDIAQVNQCVVEIQAAFGASLSLFASL